MYKGFIDTESIIIKAGDGGNGCVSFIHYNGMAMGGPDGGDGGDGGNVVFVGDRHKTSLLDFEYKHKFFAADGENGGTQNCTGKRGADIEIFLPLGTVVIDKETGRTVCDIFYDGQRETVLHGGRGGKGNRKFCNARRHAPHFSQHGEKCEIRRVTLELKTIADVGLLGFPNVGKSTLLSKISAAKPKIANYHFTTLFPNLGVVRHNGKDFVVADIPGLIEGASKGEGLGYEFLRHIERTRMLVHIVDVSGIEGRDPLQDFLSINKELKTYSEKLSALRQIVVLNKTDIMGAAENIARFKERFGGEYTILELSAIQNKGVDELLDAITEELDGLPPVKPLEFEAYSYERKNYDEFGIEKEEDGVYLVTGPLVDLLERNVVLNDPDSLAYFQKTLRDKGVIAELKKQGAEQGNTVIIGETEFDFID